MNRALRGIVVLAALIATGLLAAVVAGAVTAESLRPLNLRVRGGADVWHAVNDFRLDWDHPRTGTEYVPVAAIHLRMRNARGEVVIADAGFPWDDTQFDHIHVPQGPGRYAVDLWLEGPKGEIGEAVSTSLLFDDVPPGPARPLPPTGWVAGGEAVTVGLEHPIGPWPASGIRGYAVSVDDGSGSAPCGGPSECSLAETDLRGGAENVEVSLGLLPDGVNVVRAVAVSGAGLRSREVMSAVVRVDAHDPEVSLNAPPGWVDGPAQVTASAVDSQSGMVAAGPNGPYTAIAVEGAVPRLEFGGSATMPVTGEGSHRVSYYARDAAGNQGEKAAASAIVRIDETPPLVAFAAAQDPAAPERIEAVVSDSLSGPDPGRGSIGIRPSGSRQRFLTLPTVVSRGRLVADWDSDAFPWRTYEFRATGYDAAGNATESDRRASGARMVLTNPVKTPAQLAAGFGGANLVWQRCSRREGQRRCRHETVTAFEARPTTRTVPYGRGVTFGGRLSTVGGAGLGGLPVEVRESFGPGAAPAQRTTIVRTAPDGTFALKLGPGPNRRIEAAFAGTHTLTRTAAAEVGLRVQAGLRLHASTSVARVGGPPVIFSGRLHSLGAAMSPQGSPVELQFRLGGEWSTFRTVRTDAHGRFRYAYAFSDDDSRGIRFQFRAYAPPQAGWPYEPATSRPIFVTGR
jgi:hypothetical protein